MLTRHFYHWVKHGSIIHHRIKVFSVFCQQIFIFYHPKQFVIKCLRLRCFPSLVFPIVVPFKKLIRNICGRSDVKIVGSDMVAVDKPVVFFLEKVVKKLKNSSSNQTVVHVQNEKDFMFLTVIF